MVITASEVAGNGTHFKGKYFNCNPNMGENPLGLKGIPMMMMKFVPHLSAWVAPAK